MHASASVSYSRLAVELPCCGLAQTGTILTKRVHFYVTSGAFPGRQRKKCGQGKAKQGVKMEVTVHIPDAVRVRLGKDAEEIPRWLLEKAGLEAYRSREIGSYELRLMLGMKSRIELDGFLKTHGVYLEYTDEDFAHDAETSRQLQHKQAHSE